MKPKIKEGDLVWHGSDKCCVYEIEPDGGLGIESLKTGMSWGMVEPKHCKLIIPRKKKPKKDRKVKLTIYLSPHGAKRLASLRGWSWGPRETGEAVEFAVEAAFEHTDMGNY